MKAGPRTRIKLEHTGVLTPRRSGFTSDFVYAYMEDDQAQATTMYGGLGPPGPGIGNWSGKPQRTDKRGEGGLTFFGVPDQACTDVGDLLPEVDGAPEFYRMVVADSGTVWMDIWNDRGIIAWGSDDVVELSDFDDEVRATFCNPADNAPSRVLVGGQGPWSGGFTEPLRLAVVQFGAMEFDGNFDNTVTFADKDVGAVVVVESNANDLSMEGAMTWRLARLAPDKFLLIYAVGGEVVVRPVTVEGLVVSVGDATALGTIDTDQCNVDIVPIDETRAAACWGHYDIQTSYCRLVDFDGSIGPLYTRHGYFIRFTTMEPGRGVLGHAVGFDRLGKTTTYTGTDIAELYLDRVAITGLTLSVLEADLAPLDLATVDGNPNTNTFALYGFPDGRLLIFFPWGNQDIDPTTDLLYNNYGNVTLLRVDDDGYEIIDKLYDFEVWEDWTAAVAFGEEAVLVYSNQSYGGAGAVIYTGGVGKEFETDWSPSLAPVGSDWFVAGTSDYGGRASSQGMGKWSSEFVAAASGVNLLTANQETVETSTAGWEAETDSTITRDASLSHSGSASLRIVSTTINTSPTAHTPIGMAGFPVVSNRYYRGSAWFAPTSRTVFMAVRWYTATGAFITQDTVGRNSQQSGWIHLTGWPVEAPLGAAYAALWVGAEVPFSAPIGVTTNVDDIYFGEAAQYGPSRIMLKAVHLDGSNIIDIVGESYQVGFRGVEVAVAGVGGRVLVVHDGNQVVEMTTDDYGPWAQLFEISADGTIVPVGSAARVGGADDRNFACRSLTETTVILTHSHGTDDGLQLFGRVLEVSGDAVVVGEPVPIGEPETEYSSLAPPDLCRVDNTTAIACFPVGGPHPIYGYNTLLLQAAALRVEAGSLTVGPPTVPGFDAAVGQSSDFQGTVMPDGTYVFVQDEWDVDPKLVFHFIRIDTDDLTLTTSRGDVVVDEDAANWSWGIYRAAVAGLNEVLLTSVGSRWESILYPASEPTMVTRWTIANDTPALVPGSQVMLASEYTSDWAPIVLAQNSRAVLYLCNLNNSNTNAVGDRDALGQSQSTGLGVMRVWQM